MGWVMLSKPGTDTGPCAQPCEHTDCKATREQADAACALCLVPIGYETKFVNLGSLGPTHWLCALRERDEIAARKK
jgi:hypothetical protein